MTGVKAGASKFGLTPEDRCVDSVVMIAVGQRLNLDFNLKVVQGAIEREVSFESLLTRPTIVSVYMRNNTPGCDRQNESLVSHAAEFDEAGYNLVAVSRDACGSHQKYSAKQGIDDVLASDPEDRFAIATDSVVEKSMYGRKFTGPARAAYGIARDGTVLAVVPKVDPKDHAEQLRAVLPRL